MISTRDVLFNESSFYKHKPLPVSTELIKQLDDILVRIELPNEEPEHQIGQDEEAPTVLGDPEIATPGQEEEIDNTDYLVPILDKPGPSYPTPPPLVHYTSNTTITLPVQ